MNGNDDEVVTTMERTLEELPIGTELKDVISGKIVKIEEEMTFAPRAIYILQNF
jgi:hypothetical protein